MAARKKAYPKTQKAPLKIISVCFAVLMLLGAAAVSISEWLGGPLPTWDALYSMAGLRTDTQLPFDTQNISAKIHFIDVGQGTATLLENEGHFALVDAGDTDCTAVLLAYLQSAGVKKLDYLMLSHPHADHVGAMAKVVQNIPVERMILPDFTRCEEQPTSAGFARLLEALADEKVTTQLAAQGEAYMLGSAEITVAFTGGPQPDTLNNNSMIFLFTAKGKTCVLPGDAEEKELEAYMDGSTNVKADILAVSHHGAADASTIAFVSAVKPTYAVISCGVDNRYGHPQQKTLWNLDAVGAAVYRTDTMGTVVATIDTNGSIAFTILGKVD